MVRLRCWTALVEEVSASAGPAAMASGAQTTGVPVTAGWAHYDQVCVCWRTRLRSTCDRDSGSSIFAGPVCGHELQDATGKRVHCSGQLWPGRRHLFLRLHEYRAKGNVRLRPCPDRIAAE